MARTCDSMPISNLIGARLMLRLQLQLQRRGRQMAVAKAKRQAQHSRLPRQGDSQLASRAVCGQRADVLIPRSYHRSHHISPCLCSRCSKPDRVAHISRKGRQAAVDLQYSRELWCYICGPSLRERERACQDLIRSHLSCRPAGVIYAG